MGVDDLGIFKIANLATGFGYEREGQIVGLQAILFHLAEEKKGFVGIVLTYSFSYFRVPEINDHGEIRKKV